MSDGWIELAEIHRHIIGCLARTADDGRAGGGRYGGLPCVQVSAHMDITERARLFGLIEA